MKKLKRIVCIFFGHSWKYFKGKYVCMRCGELKKDSLP